MFYDVKKGPLKILENFIQNPLNHFWIKSCGPMEKGRIEFAISFLEPGENSGPNFCLKLKLRILKDRLKKKIP